MKKETPRSLKAQGRSGGRFERQWRQTRNAYHGARPQAKAQSERAKRGLRHNDPRVASSARPSGAGSRNQMGQKRRLGSGQQDRGGHGDNLAILGGACLPMPSLRLSPTSMNLSQLLQTLRFLEGRLRK